MLFAIVCKVVHFRLFEFISPNKSPVIIGTLGGTSGRWKGKCACSCACNVLLSSVFQD